MARATSVNLSSEGKKSSKTPAKASSEREKEEKAYRWQTVTWEEAGKQPINTQLSATGKVRAYKDMVRIRCFEQRSLRAYQQGKIGGFLHLYEGQEAVAVGAAGLLGKHDHIITAYRDHGHALAVGISMDKCMAEMFGKATGCSKGKGGSMHFFDPQKNFWGGHGIVGGQIPLGTGLAFALKYKGVKGSCLAYMGDGAVNQGAVHEAMNLAALWDLPIVFIIENNSYSMGTSQARSSAYKECLAQRAEAYGMEWDTGDGNNFYDVRWRTTLAMERAHKENRPTTLELFTYRHRGHSIADANHQTYRTKKEIETYKADRDPILLLSTQLKAEQILTDKQIKTIKNNAQKEAENATIFAEKSPYPTPKNIFENIYYEEDHPETKQSTGNIIFEDGGLL